ncbi:MAG: 23S rRNA (pseudouridine(1915)-N(3))-methyltransferase RlmH [Pseudomonadota bacterium]
MFKLQIHAVGKDHGSPTADLTSKYVDRAQDLARGLGIDGPHLNIVEAPRALTGVALQGREADLLLAGLPPSGWVILLDEGGKDVSSRGWADLIRKQRDEAAGSISFLLGGADGFSRDISQKLGGRPHRKVSLGKATWPHLLARVMVTEQIYRSLTLLAGHPYHRD